MMKHRPSSNLYRRLVVHIPFLRDLCKAKKRERLLILQSASRSEIIFLIESIYNLLNTVGIGGKGNKSKLKPYKNILRRISIIRSEAVARSDLNKYGAKFLPHLLKPLISLCNTRTK